MKEEVPTLECCSVCGLGGWRAPQVAAQPEEAVELYLAADRPRQALAILNQQLSGVLPAAVEEAATGITTTGAPLRGGLARRTVPTPCRNDMNGSAAGPALAAEEPLPLREWRHALAGQV